MQTVEAGIPDEVFNKFKEFIYKLTGIHFTEQKKYLLETRLSRRLSALGLHGFEDYFNYIAFSPRKNTEIKELLNSITTNETSFFRDSPQLAVFMDVLKLVVSEAAGKGIRVIRIWSAGCSTGEEPYTIAILIKEKFFSPNLKFEIFASDISEKVLDSAKNGIYNSYTLRNADEKILGKYFTKNEEDKYEVKNEIKSMISFHGVNLMDDKQIKTLNFFDIVFCRNVIIYFDNNSKKIAISNIYERIKPGGYLFLGHSESLHSVSSMFKLVGIGKTPLYRKE